MICIVLIRDERREFFPAVAADGPCATLARATDAKDREAIPDLSFPESICTLAFHIVPLRYDTPPR